MNETRKIAAILIDDVVGYSRLIFTAQAVIGRVSHPRVLNPETHLKSDAT
jgi:hypothetical protein